ncbi:MAG: D-alanine--D-alanine ligase [Myxococcota bacterium]|nr:D-alanine--D-alanine ligase [Myxococcota bacterium]
MSPIIGVLKGGMSSERAVSLKSGEAVAAALRSRGHTVVEIDVGPDLPQQLIAGGIDVAWIALHGAFGEDGCVQGLLEIMRIPYTGSSMAASAVAMDKIRTKRMLQDVAVMHLPGDRVWRTGDGIDDDLTWPVVAKTPNGGSTIGVYICKDAGELERALVKCTEWGEEVLLEDRIVGEEITVAVLDGTPLTPVAIRPADGFFDFEAKYTKGQTEYIVPAPIADAVTTSASAQAVAAYRTLALSGIARADFIVDADGIPWFLEINTIPGMTATSLSPMAAGATGISFEELVERLMKSARLHLQPSV